MSSCITENCNRLQDISQYRLKCCVTCGRNFPSVHTPECDEKHPLILLEIQKKYASLEDNNKQLSDQVASLEDQLGNALKKQKLSEKQQISNKKDIEKIKKVMKSMAQQIKQLKDDKDNRQKKWKKIKKQLDKEEKEFKKKRNNNNE